MVSGHTHHVDPFAGEALYAASQISVGLEEVVFVFYNVTGEQNGVDLVVQGCIDRALPSASWTQLVRSLGELIGQPRWPAPQMNVANGENLHFVRCWILGVRPLCGLCRDRQPLS